MKFIEKIKESRKTKSLKLEGLDYLLDIARDIGDIVEKEDKIIIYAKQNTLDRHIFPTLTYYLSCLGISQSKETKSKPVFYVFDGITFFIKVKLYSNSCNVIFKNCTFHEGMSGSFDNLILENNKYYDFYKKNTQNVFQLNFNDSGNLTLINNEFIKDPSHYSFEQRIKINICAKKVDIIDIHSDSKSQRNIDITADNISLINSTITGSEICIDSNSIKTENSLLNASKGIIIENKNRDFTGQIRTPMFIYNGDELSSARKVTSVNEEYINLSKKRLELLKTLQKLKNHCQQINEAKIEKIQEQLNSQQVSRVLKKK